jgi:hypothetical protein
LRSSAQSELARLEALLLSEKESRLEQERKQDAEKQRLLEEAARLAQERGEEMSKKVDDKIQAVMAMTAAKAEEETKER